MKLLIIIATFWVSIVSANDITTSAPTSAPFQCEKLGLQCKSCSRVVNCMDLGAASLVEIDTAECQVGTSCVDGVCSDKPNWQCGELKNIPFECTAVGMFPNPSSCSEFYVCYKDANNQLKAYKGECPKDYAYDSISTYCKIPMKNNICPPGTIVPVCTKIGLIGALSNKSIFYICLNVLVPGTTTTTIYPKLYLCANGKQYINNKCT